MPTCKTRMHRSPRRTVPGLLILGEAGPPTCYFQSAERIKEQDAGLLHQPPPEDTLSLTARHLPRSGAALFPASLVAGVKACDLVSTIRLLGAGGFPPASGGGGAPGSVKYPGASIVRSVGPTVGRAKPLLHHFCLQCEFRECPRCCCPQSCPFYVLPSYHGCNK